MTPADLEQYMLGTSPAMQDVRRLILRFAATDLPVLLQGPTGVGKEVAAQALHALSRRSGALVCVNSPAIPDSMFEAEMFGYVKGAFSGAVSDHLGLIGEANRGSLFMDEVVSLPLSMQPKLLRAFESGRFRPVGARGDRCSEFRIIAAANVDLEESVRSGQFRADLFHRLRVAVIEIPALDRRPEDIPVLARQFASEIRRERQPMTIAKDAQERLIQRAWPGNVRELRHLIHCAGVIAGSNEITQADLEDASPDRLAPVHASTAMDREREELLSALERNGWQVGRTAADLHVHRITLSRRMVRLGITRSFREDRKALPPAPDQATLSRSSQPRGDDRPGPECSAM